MSETPEPAEHATIRRAPKLSMFMVVGGGIGAVVTFILTAIFPVDPQVGFGPLLGYFMLYGIPAGIVLGALVGLILDRRSRRRATGVSVEREKIVEPAPETGPSLPEPERPIALEAEPLPHDPETPER